MARASAKLHTEPSGQNNPLTVPWRRWAGRHIAPRMEVAEAMFVSDDLSAPGQFPEASNRLMNVGTANEIRSHEENVKVLLTN